MGLTMDRHRRKAAVQRGDAAPVAGRSPSALLALVRLLARQAARETLLASATSEARPTTSLALSPDGTEEE